MLHPVFGWLVNDGEGFVGQCEVAWSQKTRVEVHLAAELAQSSSVAKVWKAFKRRESKVRDEIELALAAHYNGLRCDMPDAKLKRLRSRLAIWNSLGEMIVEIGRRGRNAEIAFFWKTPWE
ncbi:MAG TPA: hypothetical protein VFZ59_16920 [Verrucomicrobiae bacterium]|nr:hypothetical protein [Verrucomicrobiae bacterium]